MRLVLPSPADHEGLRPYQCCPEDLSPRLTAWLVDGHVYFLSWLLVQFTPLENQLTQLPKCVQGAAKISFLALQKLNPDGNVSSSMSPTSHELCCVHGIS